MAIYVTWIGEGPEPPGLLAGAVAVLHREYGALAHRVRADGRPPRTFDEMRRQHASRAMLGWLADRLPARGAKLLGVTDVDLFIPVLTFVFGEAQLGGHAAVVSVARLRDPRSPRLLHVRLAKEAVHEVGHTFGLVHCASRTCVMARSAGLAAVDVKQDRLCGDCRERYRETRESAYVAVIPPHIDR
jgi:archaemetzincin